MPKSPPTGSDADSAAGQRPPAKGSAAAEYPQEEEKESLAEYPQEEEKESLAEYPQEEEKESLAEYPQVEEKESLAEYPQEEEKESSAEYPQVEEKETSAEYPQVEEKETLAEYPKEEEKETSGEYPKEEEKETSGEYPKEEEKETSGEYPKEEEKETSGEYPKEEEKETSGEYPKQEEKETSGEYPKDEELSTKDVLSNDEQLQGQSSNDVALRDASSPDDEQREDSDFAELERRAHVALEYLSTNGSGSANRDSKNDSNPPPNNNDNNSDLTAATNHDKSSGGGDEEEEESARVAEHMETLREYRLQCQNRAMYVEADLVQQVLRHRRLDEETRHVRGLTEQQMQERQAVEDAHREQFRSFHRVWNARIDELEETQDELETALLERQNEELQVFYDEMEERAPLAPHASRGVIHTRAVEHILAHQRQYAQAHRTKLHADRLAARDTERYMKAKLEVFERREALLRHKHQQEQKVLSMKTTRRRAELERARKKELDVLLRRYVNVRRELELQQNIIRNKTGAILLKHANNTKSEGSGSKALVESAGSGAFGLTIQRRHMNESSGRSTAPPIAPR